MLRRFQNSIKVDLSKVERMFILSREFLPIKELPVFKAIHQFCEKTQGEEINTKSTELIAYQ
jgi:hypothetical protein